MSNPFPPPLPLPDDDRHVQDPATREVDGEEVLDPDTDPSGVDSAEADRLATGADEERPL
ncbi:hypothetical protein ACWGJP_12115 [Microbacterium sp. NPDC055903]